jgi:hypothetical protein
MSTPTPEKAASSAAAMSSARAMNGHGTAWPSASSP